MLENSRLIEVLSRHGKAEFTGSYAHDLMMSGDIDIHLFGEFDRESAKQALDELIDKTKFTGYMFFDWVEYQNPKWPRGYYIGFKQIMPGYSYQWKIDVWLLDKETEASIKYSEMLKNASEEERQTILELKYYCKKNNPMAESTEIYDAVFKDNDRTIAEFCKRRNVKLLNVSSW